MTNNIFSTDIETLIEMMDANTEPPSRLTYVIEIIGGSGHPRAEDLLLKALQHESPLIREGAIYGIELFDRETSVQKFRAAVENRLNESIESSPGVRQAAKNALYYFDNIVKG